MHLASPLCRCRLQPLERSSLNLLRQRETFILPCKHSPHAILLTCHEACHTSHVTRHTSHVTRHTSHVTRHTSHVTRHTSHVTRHTSHVTRHTSHSSPSLQPLPSGRAPPSPPCRDAAMSRMQVVWWWRINPLLVVVVHKPFTGGDCA